MLIIAATPIGNAQDASARLRQWLRDAPVIVAEDTRVARRLLAVLQVESAARLIAVHDHNERDRAEEIARLALDDDVLLISDAGMPTVSDPGYRVVRAAVDLGATVTALPGPSAVVTALAVSGLATDRFSFEGFVPRKEGERARFLQGLAGEERTMVFFESPHRLHDTLTAMVAAFGPDRAAAVCRELTKLYEEVLRGGLAELAERTADGVRGEICLVVAGAAPRRWSLEEAVAEARSRVAAGGKASAVAGEVAALTGHRRRELYQALLDA